MRCPESHAEQDARIEMLSTDEIESTAAGTHQVADVRAGKKNGYTAQDFCGDPVHGVGGRLWGVFWRSGAGRVLYIHMARDELKISQHSA